MIPTQLSFFHSHMSSYPGNNFCCLLIISSVIRLPNRSVSPPSQPPVSSAGQRSHIGVQVGHCLLYGRKFSHQCGMGTGIPGISSIMREPLFSPTEHFFHGTLASVHQNLPGGSSAQTEDWLITTAMAIQPFLGKQNVIATTADFTRARCYG